MARGIVVFMLLIGMSGTAVAGGGSDAGTARGEQIYTQFCSSCHGRYGRGDGPLASDLKQPLPDFTDSSWLAKRTDKGIAGSLARVSHGPMAVAGAMKTDALVDSIAYVRTLSVPGEHVSVLAGRDIYNATCWPCHGMNGDGKGPAAKFLTGTPPRDFTAATFVIDGREDEIAQFIGVGAAASAHGSTYMPEWSSRLSPQQIRDTVAYLKTFKKKPH
ncbi:MAG: c-type cytochrome [bacterium]